MCSCIMESSHYFETGMGLGVVKGGVRFDHSLDQTLCNNVRKHSYCYRNDIHLHFHTFISDNSRLLLSDILTLLKYGICDSSVSRRSQYQIDIWKISFTKKSWTNPSLFSQSCCLNFKHWTVDHVDSQCESFDLVQSLTGSNLWPGAIFDLLDIKQFI